MKGKQSYNQLAGAQQSSNWWHKSSAAQEDMWSCWGGGGASGGFCGQESTLGGGRVIAKWLRYGPKNQQFTPERKALQGTKTRQCESKQGTRVLGT